MKRVTTINPVPPLPEGCRVWVLGIYHPHMDPETDEPFEERFVVAASKAEAFKATGTTLSAEEADGWRWEARSLEQFFSSIPIYDEDEAEGQLGPGQYWLVRIAAGKAQRGVPFLVEDVPTRSNPWGAH